MEVKYVFRGRKDGGIYTASNICKVIMGVKIPVISLLIHEKYIGIKMYRDV